MSSGTSALGQPTRFRARTMNARTHTDRPTGAADCARAVHPPWLWRRTAGRHGRSTRSARFASRHGTPPTDPRPTPCAPGGCRLICDWATGALMRHNDLFGGLLSTPHSVDSATLHSVDLYSDDRSRLAGHLSTHMPRPAASNPNHGPRGRSARMGLCRARRGGWSPSRQRFPACARRRTRRPACRNTARATEARAFQSHPDARARTHARTRARTHARTHARSCVVWHACADACSRRRVSCAVQ